MIIQLSEAEVMAQLKQDR